MHLDSIQTSKVTLETIHLQNPQVFFYAVKKGLIGKEFEVGVLGQEPERYYKDDPWTYKINRYGFRGPNWSMKKSIALFGCSYVFGWGVEKDASQIMSESLGEQVINMGVPGAGFVHIIKTFVSFARLHPMSHAFISLPPLHRIFLPSAPEHPWDHWMWNTRFGHPGENKKFAKKLYSIWTNDMMIGYALDYIDWANTVAEKYDINVHWTSWDDPMELSGPDSKFHVSSAVSNSYNWPELNTDWARDGLHPGPTVMKEYAENCLACL